MTLHPRHRRVRHRDLTALADGSLPASRRDRVQRALAASPELRAAVAAERRALAAIGEAAGERAPRALRASVALARDPRPRRRPHRVAWASTATATAAIAAVLALSGTATPTPSVAEAAVLASRAPVAPTPAPPGDSVTLPRLRAAGLPFPYWEDRFGFKAVGVRRDRLDGREATTVFYDLAGHRVAYTIVSGAPLPAGAATSSTSRLRIELRRLVFHGRSIVTWLRRGHTCVLSGDGVPSAVLLGLAAWDGAGRIPY